MVCNRAVPSDYRLSRPLAARFMGLFLAALGVAVFALTVLVAVFALSLTVLSVGVVLAVAAVLLGGLALTRSWYVVRLDDAGYRVRFVRGAGVTHGRWKDVEDVVATTVAGDRCVVLRRRDGRTTTVPVDVLEGDPAAFLADLRSHLDRGHGYRRIG